MKGGAKFSQLVKSKVKGLVNWLVGWVGAKKEKEKKKIPHPEKRILAHDREYRCGVRGRRTR